MLFDGREYVGNLIAHSNLFENGVVDILNLAAKLIGAALVLGGGEEVGEIDLYARNDVPCGGTLLQRLLCSGGVGE